MNVEMLSHANFNHISEAKVLVVDDNKHNQELFVKFFEAMNITDIKCADDGISAIGMMTKEEYDLVILDMLMPNMNGEEFLYKIREVPYFQTIPVIVQTANTSIEAQEKMFKAGASDFVTKPISPLEFSSRVQVHLENRMLIKTLNKQIEKMSNDTEQIRKMQEYLYPTTQKVDSISNIYTLKIDYRFEICSRIGGNFWDLIKIDDNKLLLLLGEVSGYGVSTSMNVFRMKTLLDEVKNIKKDTMDKYFSNLNDTLEPLLLRGQYVAMSMILFDFNLEKAYYVNAGYQSPIIKKGSGKLEAFSTKSSPLGLTKSSHYEVEEKDFTKGDTFYGYGSAILNGKDSQDIPLGIEKIKDYITTFPEFKDVENQLKSTIKNIDDEDFILLSLTKL